MTLVRAGECDSGKLGGNLAASAGCPHILAVLCEHQAGGGTERMSKQILTISLQLPDGKVLTGRGRNLPGAIRRIYNEAAGEETCSQITLTERLKTGHTTAKEHRYQGTFHAQLANRRGEITHVVATVLEEVRGGKAAVAQSAPASS